ncbi:MAG: hypothetical protein HQ522_18120 [Bacteroidetes bacterium]|nr:hypothetical protein [Bacteroidota bacterium]
MKRIFFLIIILMTSILSYSQIKEYENTHFLKFKIYQTEFDMEVPFAEICISSNNDNYFINCNSTDFDGYTYFHINPNIYNIDSTVLRIRILQGNTINDYGKPIKIPLNQIELFKEFKFDHDLIIAVTEYKILSEKEYKKHRKKYGLMPPRQPSKAVDVR